ncbi:MAG: hypothetical protein JF585_09285, partial [Burkholderiales bacterium]|nr:hypothetical protein [Burkholderiales bacterium]
MSTHSIAESAHLRIRPTMLSDLDFVVSVEQDARNLTFITPWERTQARPRPRPGVCSTMRLSSTERFGLRQPCRITK